jgi:hypothetical protein
MITDRPAQGGLPYETQSRRVHPAAYAFAGVVLGAVVIVGLKWNTEGDDPARMVRDYITQRDSCLHDTDFNPQNGALGPIDTGSYVDIKSGAGRLPEELKLVQQGNGFVGYDALSRHILSSAGCTLDLRKQETS